MVIKRASQAAETLAVHIGTLFELDLPFMKLRAEGELAVRRPGPVRFTNGTDVLLAATEQVEHEGLYFVVGVLREAILSKKRDRLTFGSVERFPLPVLVSRDGTTEKRTEIVGPVDGWGPIGFYYLAADAVRIACRDGTPAIPAAKATGGKGAVQVAEPLGSTHDSPSDQVRAGGSHRVYLHQSESNHFVVYMPLRADGRLEPAAPQPWLFEALWDGYEYVGIFRRGEEGGNYFDWPGREDEPCLTDLGTVPVKVGGTVRIYEGSSTDYDDRVYLVRDVSRV